MFLIDREENEADVLVDAKRKLDDIRYRLWFYVAKELKHGDPYLFLRAYTAGSIRQWNPKVERSKSIPPPLLIFIQQ